MKKVMRLMASVVALSVVGPVWPSDSQAVTPFKLGAFELNGRTFLGLVLNDSRVIEIEAANTAYQSANRSESAVMIPTGMNQLIADYDSGIGARLRSIATAEAARTSGPYIYDVKTLNILPPTRPAVILNAAANYPEHLAGINEQNARASGSASGPARSVAAPAGGQGDPAPKLSQSAPGIWERKPGETRPDNPYLFMKSPSVMVGANDDVVIPKGRTQIDWECEFATVIGKRAKNVPLTEAGDHIFGYTIEFDVSDRGGRGDLRLGGGPDWFTMKNHDTFAPIGPFIVPKEFLPNPMNVRHYFTLNGEIYQDSNTSRMEYDIYEMLSYGSNVLTLNPGDIIAYGSPAGTNMERSNPRWMRAGDVGVCTIEGVGVQHHTIVDEQ